MSRTTYTIALLGFLAIKVKGDKIIGVSTGNGNPVYQGNVKGGFEDTWGTSSKKSLPVTDPLMMDEISKCTEFTDRFLKDVPQGTANLYYSSESFDKFQGTDLVPENKAAYLRGNAGGERFFQNMNFNDARAASQEILLRSCQVASAEEGWTWNVQRVGPFETTGNYDYTQIGWHDFGNLGPDLEKHPEGILLDKHAMVPVEDGTWKPLGHPPLHIHHIHLMQDKYGDSVRSRTSFAKYNVSLVLEQHGDYQCLQEEGGVTCLYEQNAQKLGKLITMPLDGEGEINDVRAPRSDKITWWYQVAIRWTANKKKVDRQLSQEFILGAGELDYFRQKTYVLTYPTPTDAPTLYWYSGEMWTDGSLVRNKLHSHNSIFHSAYFINASPQQLGLDDPKFLPKKAFLTQYISDLGFQGIDDLADWILNHLDSPDQVICKGYVQGEKVDGFLFDRRAPCQCREWIFKKGDPFTVIAFSEHDGEPLGPHMPDYVPAYVPSHVHWLMQYIDHNSGSSIFGMSLFSHTGYSGGSRVAPGIYELLYTIYQGGVLQRSERTFLTSWYFHAFMITVFLALAAGSVWYCCRRSKKHRTATEKKIDTFVDTVYEAVPQKGD